MSETCRVSFQNKFEKLVHLVGFIIRICHGARSHGRKICTIHVALHYTVPVLVTTVFLKISPRVRNVHLEDIVKIEIKIY
jgi:hypothetical protein